MPTELSSRYEAFAEHVLPDADVPDGGRSR